MKVELKMVIVLTLIGFFSGGVLYLVNNATKEQIEENLKKETLKAIKEIFPNASNKLPKKIFIDRTTSYFKIHDEKGNLIGYAVVAEGPGFQGDIKLLVGLKPDLKEIVGLYILEQVETPGLGAEIVNPNWRNQFKGKKLPLVVIKQREPKTKNEIKAITGATISSRSVVNIIHNAVEKVKKKEGK